MEKIRIKKKKIIKCRNRRRNRNLELAVKIGLCVIFVAVGGLGIYQFVTKEDVKLAELTKISLIGYDSEGKINVELDATPVMDKLPQLQQVLDTVEMDFSQEEHLSNGDTVEITYTYDEELAKELDIRLGDDKSVLTVENLPQAEKITMEDLFEDVELVYEGIAPALQVSVNNNSEHPYIKTMDFVIRNAKEFYQKGDTITIDAVFSEEDAIAYRYAVEKGTDGYSKSYDLDGIDSYLTDEKQLSQDAIDTLIAEGQKCFTDANEYGLRIFSEAGRMPIWINKKTTFTWKSPYVISMYFNTATEEALGDIGVMANDVKIVYGVILTQADGVSCDAEIVVRFDGLVEKADGTIDLALESGSMISASHKDKFIKDIVNNGYTDEVYKSVRIL